MYQKETIGLQEAQDAITAILSEQAKDPQTRPVSVAVVDENGDLVAFVRMDTGRSMTGDIAIKKAYTSVRTRSNSGVFAERMKQQGRSVAEMGDPKMIGVQGGVCVMKPRTQVCVGAIGVSGLASEEDEALAEKGIQALKLK